MDRSQRLEEDEKEKMQSHNIYQQKSNIVEFDNGDKQYWLNGFVYNEGYDDKNYWWLTHYSLLKDYIIEDNVLFDKKEPDFYFWEYFWNSVLTRKDKTNNIKWQKVYYYYHEYIAEYGYGDGYTINYYFHNGNIIQFDNGLTFVAFKLFSSDDSSPDKWKIFRLDENGMTKTNDKNLYIMDYKEYREKIKNTVADFDRRFIPMFNQINLMKEVK